MAVKKKASPMMTRTGKPRLGPLNFEQLNKLIAQTSKPKEKAKIQKRINEVAKRQGIASSEVVAEE